MKECGMWNGQQPCGLSYPLQLEIVPVTTYLLQSTEYMHINLPHFLDSARQFLAAWACFSGSASAECAHFISRTKVQDIQMSVQRS